MTNLITRPIPLFDTAAALPQAVLPIEYQSDQHQQDFDTVIDFLT